jgi:hypothetical protein
VRDGEPAAGAAEAGDDLVGDHVRTENGRRAGQRGLRGEHGGRPAGPANPHHNAFHTEATLLRSEEQAQPIIDPLAGRFWKIVNPSVLCYGRRVRAERALAGGRRIEIVAGSITRRMPPRRRSRTGARNLAAEVTRTVAARARRSVR